jgi:hypothetical protein
MTSERINEEDAMYGDTAVRMDGPEGPPGVSESGGRSTDEELNYSCVWRDPLQICGHRNTAAANALAKGRRTLRLLWIALIFSSAAHMIIPVCIVTTMVRPEKVALMDGTESLIIAPLVPLEENNEILETLSVWAAKSFLYMTT